MLYKIDEQGKLSNINQIPYRKDFEIWMDDLSSDNYQAIYVELSNVLSSLPEDEESGDFKLDTW